MVALLSAVPEGIDEDLVVLDGNGYHCTAQLKGALHHKWSRGSGA